MAQPQLIQARKQKNMECAPSVEVGDLVYLDPNNPNTVITAIDNNTPEPIIGLVVSKSTSTNARILINGIIRLSINISSGRLFVGTTGGLTLTPPSSNYLQEIGKSFGDDIIDFEPVHRRVKRS